MPLSAVTGSIPAKSTITASIPSASTMPVGSTGTKGSDGQEVISSLIQEPVVPSSASPSPIVITTGKDIPSTISIPQAGTVQKIFMAGVWLGIGFLVYKAVKSDKRG